MVGPGAPTPRVRSLLCDSGREGQFTSLSLSFSHL